jgi:tetratricopeptide (TPR) repeat protein
MNRRYGALAEAEQALRFDSEDVISHVAYGYACLITRDEDGLRSSILRIRELDPNSYEGLRLECLVALREGRPEELRNAAESLLRANPQSSEGKIWLSRSASMQGQGAKAELLAREALAEEPNSPAAHEAIGWAFYAQNELAKARAAALSALSISPQRWGARSLLGSVQLRKNRLTGWFYRIGLWLYHQSNIRQIMLLLVAIFLFNSAKEFVRFFQIPYGIDVLRTSQYTLLAMAIIPALAMRQLLNKELRQVRLTREY